MELRFTPNGIIQIDDARLVYRNFSGAPSKFNREGDRNFAVVIPDEDMKEALRNEGWNVKVKPPRDEEEAPFMYLPVKVKFNDRGPAAYLKSGGNMVRLSEDTIACLDDIYIQSVDLDVRPYDWEIRGETGRTAYLQSIHVTQMPPMDRFAARYEESRNNGPVYSGDDEDEHSPY